MIYSSVGAAEGGIFLRQGVPLFHQMARETPAFTHSVALHFCAATHARRDKTMPICMGSHIHALVLPFSPSPPFALFQQFPAHTFCLSWYIQSMNTRSQQVWTQLLNIQPCAPLFLTRHLCLSFYHSPTLNSPYSSPLSRSSLTPPLFLPASLCSSLQLRRCLCSLCSTFIKGLSSDSPSYNT